MTSQLSQALTTLVPMVILGIVLLALLIWPLPGPNENIATTIVAGLLGFMSRGDRSNQSPAAGAPPAGSAPDSEA